MQLAADDRLVGQLLTFDAGSENLEEDSEAAEGPPVRSVDRLPAKVTASYAPSTGRPQRRAFIFNGEDGPRQIDARLRFEAAL